jgi:hypothetical protein
MLDYRNTFTVTVLLALAGGLFAVDARADQAPDVGKLDGAWRLVSYTSGEAKESRNVPEGLEYVKLITGGRFVSTLVNQGKVVQSVGGRCAVENEWYYEKVAFVFDKQDEWMVGMPAAFKWKVEGNRWSHKGVIRGEKAEAHVSEVWERLDPGDRKGSVKEKFTGIGVTIQKEAVTDMLLVVTPIKEGPADKAGVQAGDIITRIIREVDSEGFPLSSPEVVSTKGLALSDAAKKIQGKPGTKVKLVVQRQGEATLRELTISRARIEVQASDKRPELEGAWRLTSFKSGNAETYTDVAEGSEQVKLVVGGRFVWVSVKDKKVVRAAGGTCSMSPDEYSETIGFVADKVDDWMLSRTGRFKWGLDSSKWYHDGTIPGARGMVRIAEVWSRIK